MKFHSKSDIEQFLVEIGFNPYTMMEGLDDTFKPTEEMLELYVTRRRKVVGTLKNFRKSQNQKANWRKNKYKYMKGIKKFHNSTSGKRFHRSLGRFISTREFRDSMFKRESYQEMSEVLVALSSLKTHHFIELDYYHPLDEEIDYQLFGDEVAPAIYRIEKGLTDEKGIGGEDLDLLFRLVDRKALTLELAEHYKVPTDQVIKLVDSSLTDELHGINEYLEATLRIKKHLKEMNGSQPSKKEVT